MFNAADRLPIVVDMIVAETAEDRRAALDRLLPIQRADFVGIFRGMAPHPVTIRLLDPPIHEFLPTERQLEDDIARLHDLRGAARGMEVLTEAARFAPDTLIPATLRDFGETRLIDTIIARKEAILRKARALREVNPMLGHRGVRLGITYPEIYTMQIRAVLEAAADCVRSGVEVRPEIMVPQVCTAQELNLVRDYMSAVQKQVELTYGVQVPCRFGTMVEVVRACMRAENLAEVAEFFSFGTNDLTQATFSFSREDAENKFLPMYNERGILQDNPVRGARREGRRAIDGARRGMGPSQPARTQGRHLRGARRSPGLDRLLRFDRARLRLVFGAAGADCEARRRAGGDRQCRSHGQGGVRVPSLQRRLRVRRSA